MPSTPHPAPASAGSGLLRAHWWFVGVVLVSLLLSRLALLFWVRDRIGGGAEIASVLLGGLRMDLVVVCYLVAPAVIFSLLTGGANTIGRWSNRLTRAYLTAVTAGFLFLELATPAFVREFDSRPNRLFLEYLVHPREITSMLWKGYRGEVFLIAGLVTVILLLAWRLYARPLSTVRRTAWWKRPVLFAWIAPLLFLGARSSTKHRPANPSTVAFSSDHLLNDLCLSSMYSVLYAGYQIKDEADAGDVYGTLREEETISEVRARMSTVAEGDFLSAELPTLHTQRASRDPERPLNLVVILEESLGAQYVGALGGRPVTRFLDTLQDEGWWFDAMYATGTRSVRGIEAVVSGFLPTPARSVVKLGRSQQGFFTMAELLANEGYHTQFVYGGEAHFDNMRRFFTGNGFEEIVEEKDYVDPLFHGSWGVSDLDILRRAHEGFVALGERPFFSLVFTVTNHSPWEYPQVEGFEPFNEPAATTENCVRFADHALSEFFALAREAPYWDNTVFLVIADHDARVTGASLVPIPHFHIPAVILAPGLEPRRDGRVTSQFDMPPTLLSLMGISSAHPMVGHDLTRLPEDAPGRAIMQYGVNQAHMVGDQVVVLQPDLPPSQYRYTQGELQPIEQVDPDLVHCALAHALLPSFLYRERLYRLPVTE